MCYLPPLLKSAENRNARSHIHTVSFQPPPPPALPFGFSFLLFISAGRSSLSLPPISSPTFPLLLSPPPPALVSVCQVEKGVISSPLRRSPVSLRHHLTLRICVCVYERAPVCVYTVCVCDRALTQPVKCRNILLHWIGTILKRWHEDYYSIWLHQICTIPKWYYTSLSSRVIYPFKWTFISHVLKQRPWRGTIQSRLPGIWRLLFFRVSDGFLPLENTEAEFLCQHKYHSVKLKHFYILKLVYRHVHNMHCCVFFILLSCVNVFSVGVHLVVLHWFNTCSCPRRLTFFANA